MDLIPLSISKVFRGCLFPFGYGWLLFSVVDYQAYAQDYQPYEQYSHNDLLNRDGNSYGQYSNNDGSNAKGYFSYRDYDKGDVQSLPVTYQSNANYGQPYQYDYPSDTSYGPYTSYQDKNVPTYENRDPHLSYWNDRYVKAVDQEPFSGYHEDGYLSHDEREVLRNHRESKYLSLEERELLKRHRENNRGFPPSLTPEERELLQQHRDMNGSIPPGLSPEEQELVRQHRKSKQISPSLTPEEEDIIRNHRQQNFQAQPSSSISLPPQQIRDQKNSLEEPTIGYQDAPTDPLQAKSYPEKTDTTIGQNDSLNQVSSESYTAQVNEPKVINISFDRPCGGSHETDSDVTYQNNMSAVADNQQPAYLPPSCGETSPLEYPPAVYSSPSQECLPVCCDNGENYYAPTEDCCTPCQECSSSCSGSFFHPWLNGDQCCNERDNWDLWIYPDYLYLGYTGGRGIGYKRGYATIGAFLAPSKFQINNFQPFVDVAGYCFNNGKWAASAGGGTRYILPNHNLVLGGYVFYDYRRLHRFDLNQIGVGFEMLGPIWDFRINGYIPVGDSTFRRGTLFHYSGGHNAIRQNRISTWGGFDAEVGTWLMRKYACDWFGLYLAAGPYYYTRERHRREGDRRHHDAFGGRVRLLARVTDFIDLSVIATYDPIWHTRVQGQVTLAIPFDCSKSIFNQWIDCGCDETPCLIEQIATQPVVRNPIIVADSHCSWLWDWCAKGCSSSSGEPTSHSVNLSSFSSDWNCSDSSSSSLSSRSFSSSAFDPSCSSERSNSYDSYDSYDSYSSSSNSHSRRHSK